MKIVLLLSLMAFIGIMVYALINLYEAVKESGEEIINKD
jgi:hypothetical protein